MYGIKQISQSFQNILFSQAGEGASGGPEDSSRPQAKPDDLKAKALANLSPDQQKKLESLESIKKELDALDASEKIVGTKLEVIGNSLLKIKQNPTDKANPDDFEYKQLVEMFDRLKKEYDAISKDTSQTAHILSYYLSEFEGKIDESISDVWAENNKTIDASIKEGKNIFTLEDIKKLETTKGERKEVVEKLLIASLGEKYTGGNISTYGTKIEDTVSKEYFNRYMKVISETKAETTDVNEKGELYSNDIFELTNIAQEMNILARDKKIFEGKEFGTLRSEEQIKAYTTLLESKDEKILDIISPKDENNIRVPKDISKLTNAEILALADTGYDVRKLFFIGSDGKQFNPESLKVDSTFVINIGKNQDASILGLQSLENRPNIISMDGLRVEYQKDGENGPGYYGENGMIELKDGVLVKVLEMGKIEDSKERTTNQEAQKKQLMDSSAGRDMYRQALENPDSPIKAKGLLAQILLTILEVMTGKKLTQSADGTFQIQNEAGEYVPVTGAEYMKKYTGSIQSHPVEKSKNGTTLCGRTAYKNLLDLGAKNPQINDAHVLLKNYQSGGKNSNLGFPTNMPEDTKSVQLFMDASKENAAKGYRHTSCAFKDSDGNWQVLDPYYLMGRSESERLNPIPAGVYMNYMRGTLGKQFYGAFDV